MFLFLFNESLGFLLFYQNYSLKRLLRQVMTQQSDVGISLQAKQCVL